MVQRSPTRSSRRRRGEEPTTILEDDNQSKPISIEVKALISKGGRSGRINESHDKCDYFPNDKDKENKNYNISKEKNILDTSDDKTYVDNESIKEKTKNSKATHHLMHMRALKDLLSENLTCKCSVNTAIDNFIEHCSIQKKQLTCKNLKALKKEWENKYEIQNRIKIKVKT